ncbi:MAG: sulfur carrier protein ThiS [Spirochaetales bacterium]|uniref:Sulfur carrier protein ThiS n=1 Tax=Candidatus Thalassospirochaeta sargassi TaxID=3119039 RepID=A0AAJ1I9J7_9SPIO|nr:sulfur carrier protein ThiS [Spirochaetales bacterium]
MLKVNGKDVEWREGLSFSELYRQIGYTISNPRVIVKVNGEKIAKAERKEYNIPDSAEIEVINTLCGG